MKNNNIQDKRIIYTICLLSNIVFFALHLLYIIAFLISKAYIMAYINLGSSILYLLFFYIIKKEKYPIYTVLACLEITAYMNVATIICGYNAGFHLCFIGLCVLAYVAKYFLKEKTLINPFILVIVFALDYVFLYLYCLNVSPVVELGNVLNSIFFIGHSIIVFVFVIGFMVLLVRYVLFLEKKITKESVTDKLTQLGNRNSLADYLDKINKQKANYVLAMFDIDDFKVVNDIYGHLYGDYILKTIAQIAKDNSEDDLAIRWGGEEFVIISKIDETLEKTYEKLDNIRIKINDHKFIHNNKKVHCSITIGVAKYEDGYTLDDWITKADKKLYEGKNSGKNKIVY